MDFATGFAAGLVFGKKKFGGGGEEEWKPPSDWPEVPEPGDYEMCLLAYANANYNRISFCVTEPGTANTGEGRIIVDWGDGTTETINGTDEEGHVRSVYTYHTYENEGFYVVKVLTDEKNCFFQLASSNYMLIAKLGKNIVLNDGIDYHTQSAFYGQKRLQYIKLNCEGDLPLKNAFYGCSALQKIDIRIPPKIIRYSTFSGAYSLRDFDFSEVISVEDYGFNSSGFDKIDMPKCTDVGEGAFSLNYALREINLPNCVTVGNSAFSSAHSLQKVSLPKCEEMGNSVFSGCNSLTEAIISDECRYGNSCFSDCWALIPKPDGTL